MLRSSIRQRPTQEPNFDGVTKLRKNSDVLTKYASAKRITHQIGQSINHRLCFSSPKSSSLAARARTAAIQQTQALQLIQTSNARKIMASTTLEGKTTDQYERSPHYAALKRAEAYIAENYARGLTLEQVATYVDMAPTYFSRVFKHEQGCTFIEYLTRIRLEEAKRLLRTTTLPVADIGYAIGYQSSNYLAEVFKATERITPGAYRRNHTCP